MTAQPENQVQRLMREQEQQCFWCRKRLTPYGMLHHLHGKATTVEHFVPRKHGGTNRVRNKVIAHRKCNQKRGHSWPSMDDMRRFVELKGDDGKAELARVAVLIHAQLRLPGWEIL